MDDVENDLVDLKALLKKLTTGEDEEGIRTGPIPLLNRLDQMESSIVDGKTAMKDMGRTLSDVLDKLAKVHDEVCILKKAVSSTDPVGGMKAKVPGEREMQRNLRTSYGIWKSTLKRCEPLSNSK